MRKQSLFQVIFLLTPFIFAFAFALDIYIPAVPEIMHEFHTNQEIMQLTLSLFISVIGIGQLLLGPFSDHFGRKPSLVLSILLFIFGSLLGSTSWNIDILILARMIQALGCCGMIVIAFAIVRDLFDQNESVRVYSYLNCGLAISPLFAPIIGSYLEDWFNWRAEFIFLTLMGLIILGECIFFLPETLLPSQRTKLDWNLLTRYSTILKNKTFVIYGLYATTAIIMFFTFFSISPYLIINVLGFPIKYFGYCFALVGATFLIGSLINGGVISRIGVYKAILLGLSITMFAGIGMIVWNLLFGISLAGFILPSMVLGIGLAFVLGAGTAGALQPFTTMSGSVSAVLGCLQFSLASIIGMMVMHWQVSSTEPLAIIIILLTSFCLVINIVNLLSSTRAYDTNN